MLTDAVSINDMLTLALLNLRCTMDKCFVTSRVVCIGREEQLARMETSNIPNILLNIN